MMHPQSQPPAYAGQQPSAYHPQAQYSPNPAVQQPHIWTPPPANFNNNGVPQQQQAYNPQQPPYNPQQASSPYPNQPYFNPAAPMPTDFNSFTSNPLVQVGVRQLGDQFQSTMQRQVGSWINLAVIRYYFHVNNQYVLQKLKIVLLPFTHKHWRRERIDGGDNTALNHPQAAAAPPMYQPPSQDVNAPDLYIPLMAFFTYVLALSYATALSGKFNPEFIGVYASSAMVILVLECALMHAAFYLISAASQPSLIDTIAILSYKYVHCVLAIIVGILFGSLPLYCAVLVLGSCNGLFVMRTIKRALAAGQDVASLQAQQQQAAMKANYFLLIIGIAQVALVGILCYGAVQY